MVLEISDFRLILGMRFIMGLDPIIRFLLAPFFFPRLLWCPCSKIIEKSVEHEKASVFRIPFDALLIVSY